MIKAILVLLFSYMSIGLWGQTLTKFTYSDCLKDCVEDGTKTKEIITIEGITKIFFMNWATCSGNFEGEIEIASNEMLNLWYQTKPTKYKNNKGEEYELVEVADCDCIFEFTYEISGLVDINPNSIRVNGIDFSNIGDIFFEEEEEEGFFEIMLDSIR